MKFLQKKIYFFKELVQQYNHYYLSMDLCNEIMVYLVNESPQNFAELLKELSNKHPRYSYSNVDEDTYFYVARYRLAIFLNDLEMLEKLSVLFLEDLTEKTKIANSMVTNVLMTSIKGVLLPNTCKILSAYFLHYSRVFLVAPEPNILAEAENNIYNEFHLEAILLYYFLIGDSKSLKKLLDNPLNSDFNYTKEAQGLLPFMEGDVNEAFRLFSAYLKNLEDTNKKLKNPFFKSWMGFFYLISAFAQNDNTLQPKIKDYIKALKNKKFIKYSLMAETINCYMLNLKEQGETAFSQIWAHQASPADYVFSKLTLFWAKKTFINDTQIAKIEQIILKSGYHWLIKQWVDLNEETNGKKIEVANKVYEMPSVIKYIEQEAEWKKTLQLLAVFDEKPDAKKQDKTGRFCWIYDFPAKKIYPKEQKLNKNGSWSVLKNVAIKKLKETGNPYMTMQDAEIMRTFKPSNYYYYDYEIDFDLASKLLVGHNLVFVNEANPVPAQIVKAEPEIYVRKNKGREDFMVAFNVPANKIGIVVQKETNTRFLLYEISETHKRIADSFGGNSFIVPKEGKDMLVKALGKLVNFTNVNSETAEIGIDLPKVESNSIIHALLIPSGEEGLKLELLVKPFTSVPPYLKIGANPEIAIGEIDKQKYQAIRDFKTEKANLKTVLNLCPILKGNANAQNEWEFDDLESCLELLCQLEDVLLQENNKTLVVEWPQGQKFKIGQKIVSSDFNIRISKQNDWFDVDMDMHLDGGGIIKMHQIMEMLRNAKGRFIQMQNGEFIALTDKVRKRLDEIRAYTDESKDRLRFHNLASMTIDEITQEFENVKTDTAWKNQIKKIKEASKINPKVPSTLKTELRGYQVDGFKWLAQLSTWGVGACLADDMGLGKTIQTLALLLHRANEGVALVIAPPTVARNWVNETQKFAPTLNVILFGGKDREQQLNDLKDHDIVICSYGLLQQEAELITKIKWATIVLDEAQNIKNMSTKRSKAAMELKGNFKMITTGTPVENHLGELWNLFRFVNPGLLGSINHFNERYANEIERNQNVERQKQLQKLLKPFILRRRKSQVLEELPSKTEITLQVDMSQDETAFYEALSLNIIEKLQKNAQNIDIGEGEKKLQILAEIMKLRQASCNPKLVVKDTEIASSKLEALLETAQELQENGHKALIFSQFVGHLTLIREAFDKKCFSYVYLDGSTPMKKREENIKSFQNGEVDFFLISLKAGGVGLNLTAADYVIHMDPWWNPAVEDQASDRAHRIGQKRPVTIYRFVSKGTIEEKILSLHQDKRDLADNLLEGTEMSAKISTDELLELIKQA